MAQNAIGNSAGIFLQGSQNYSAAQNKIFDAISQAAEMQQKIQMQRDANLNAARIKQAEIDAAKQKQLQDIMNDPEKVSMMIGSKYNADPSSVTPEEMAAFRTAQQVLSSKNMQDQYGNVRPAYTPITLGAMQTLPQGQPQTVADVLLPPPVIGQKQEVPATEFTQKPKEQSRGYSVSQTAEEVLKQQGIEKPKKPEKMDFASAEQYKADVASYNDALKAKREEMFALQKELPKVKAASNSMLSVIDGILNDKALDSSTGGVGGYKGAITSNMPITKGQIRIGSRFDQLKGKVFLDAYQSLRGGGAITEVEGKKAEDAMARLNLRQSPEDVRQALTELKGVVTAGLERANAQASGKQAKVSSGLTGLSALPNGFKDMGNGIVVGPDGKKYKMHVK